MRKTSRRGGSRGSRTGKGRGTLEKGLDFLFSLQDRDGSLAGGYGGSLFLTPFYVCVAAVIGRGLEGGRGEGLRRYLLSRQNGDGSFGLHVEGEGTVFVTALAYTALRILGEDRSRPALRRALRWVGLHGSPACSAPWGKFVLALMGLYPYEGLVPVLPELWLLPEASPIHPSKMWCHTRVVYLPMAWLYARRVRAAETPLIASLREELYGGRYETIDWRAAREKVSPADEYRPAGFPLRAADAAMGLYERIALRGMREKALTKVLDHIRHEDDSTDFIDIGPVNKLLNTACEWSVDPSSRRFEKAAARLDDYLEEREDGICVKGYNSVQLWDTVLAAQAAVATGLIEDRAESVGRMQRFIRGSQVTGNVDEWEKYYRDPSRGGWPFSNRPHGWPVSDCTAEAFKAAALLAGLERGGRPLVPREERVDEEMMKAAIELILFLQNGDGGWASYEKRRGSAWYEHLNPSRIFADIMTDFSYVECSSSCMQALSLCLVLLPGWREAEIRGAVERGKEFILSMQRRDGSWEGSWGVCFTYGAWFATWGLRAAGLPPWHEALAKTARYLVGRQHEDGGWGEHYTSCTTRRYVSHDRSQPVMTAWALMALMAASGLCHPHSALVQRNAARREEADHGLVTDCIERGIGFLEAAQGEDGDWQGDAITGVFNKTSMISYENYRRYFPLWALGLYENREGRKPLLRGRAGSGR